MFERFLNPVLVRAMRQAVRNRLVMSVLCLYLLALVWVCLQKILIDLTEGGVVNVNLDTKEVFFYILYITFGANAAAVVLYTAGRLIAERIGEDMMYVSALRPMTIAFGKFSGGFVITLLFHFVTLPFITLVYELRGIDVTVIFGCLLVSFLMIQTLNAMVLGFFSGVRTIFDAVIRIVPFVLCVCMYVWVNWGIWIITLLNSKLIGVSLFLFLSVIVGGFMFVIIPVAFLLLAACQLASPLSNRMFLTRHVMTWFGLLSLAVCIFVDLCFAGFSMLIWTLFAMYPCLFFCTIAACERDHYGLRLRTTIPKSFGRRLYAFPLYTGDCNAFVWLAMGIIIAFLASIIGILFNKETSYQEAFVPLFSTILFSFNYSALAVAVRYPLRRWISKDQTWMVIAALLFVGFLLPFLFLAAVNNTSAIQNDWYNYLILVPNPIWIYHLDGSSVEKILQISIAGVWFLLTLPFIALWAKRRFQEFIRYEIPAESSLAAPLAEC